MTTDDTPIETSEAEARPWKPSDGYLPAGGEPTQPAEVPQPVAQGDDYGTALLAAWDAVRDPGPAGDDVPHPVFAAGFKAGWSANAVAPAGVVGETVAISVEAVAEVSNGDEGLTLSWLIEGGIHALEPGDILIVASQQLTDDYGAGQVYAAPPARQALTDEQIDGLSSEWVYIRSGNESEQYAALRNLARAVECACAEAWGVALVGIGG